MNSDQKRRAVSETEGMGDMGGSDRITLEFIMAETGNKWACSDTSIGFFLIIER